jgi:hypothetical protein
VEGALESIPDAIGVEIRARAILLDDLRQSQLSRLIGRKSLLARKTAPAAANRITGFRNPRVDDLGLRASAKRAFHRLKPSDRAGSGVSKNCARSAHRPQSICR